MKVRSRSASLTSELHKKIQEFVEACSNEDTDAVPMKRFANSLNVTKTVFKSLPADALLTKLPEGFGIYINPGKTCPEHLERTYLNEGGQSWLPNRVRFTFAHEFAHIFIEELAATSGGIHGLLPTDKTGYIDSLEITCNNLAAEILLPAKRFDKFLWEKVEPNEPLAILKIANNFKVSSQVIINHLARNPKILNLRCWKGCVYLIDFHSNGTWKKISDYKSKLFSAGEFRCDKQQGNEPFLGIWDFDANVPASYSEMKIERSSNGAIIRFSIDEIWTKTNQRRLLISLCEA